LVEPVDAALPRPQQDEDAAKATKISTTREELYSQIKQGARLDRNYLLLVVFSTVVAAIGLIEDNVAVIVGARVIAPLLGPILAFAFAPLCGRHLYTMLTVRCKHTVENASETHFDSFSCSAKRASIRDDTSKAGEVNPRLGHQSGEAKLAQNSRNSHKPLCSANIPRPSSFIVLRMCISNTLRCRCMLNTWNGLTASLICLLSSLGASAVLPLIDTLKDENSSVRRAVIEALGKLGAAAVMPLIDTLKSGDDEACWAAARV